jgi:uncharacterized membrane protein
MRRSGLRPRAAGSLLGREGMHDKKRDALLPLTLLAAASGGRTMAGVAAISARTPPRLLAAAELIADKVPSVPNRVDPALIVGRIAAGALVGVAVAGRTGRNRSELALIGGLIAFASTHATYKLRRALSGRLPSVAAALVEDALVVGAAAVGAALLRADR